MLVVNIRDFSRHLQKEMAVDDFGVGNMTYITSGLMESFATIDEKDIPAEAKVNIQTNFQSFATTFEQMSDNTVSLRK